MTPLQQFVLVNSIIGQGRHDVLIAGNSATEYRANATPPHDPGSEGVGSAGINANIGYLGVKGSGASRGQGEGPQNC